MHAPDLSLALSSPLRSLGASLHALRARAAFWRPFLFLSSHLRVNYHVRGNHFAPSVRAGGWNLPSFSPPRVPRPSLPPHRPSSRTVTLPLASLTTIIPICRGIPSTVTLPSAPLPWKREERKTGRFPRRSPRAPFPPPPSLNAPSPPDHPRLDHARDGQSQPPRLPRGPRGSPGCPSPPA